MNILFLSFGLNEKQKIILSTMKNAFLINGYNVSDLDMTYFEYKNISSYTSCSHNLFLSNSSALKLWELLQREEYNLIICLDSVACDIACLLRKRCAYKCCIIMLQSDYSYHNEYLDLNADAFFLTSDLFTGDYQRKIDKDKLFTYLIPVSISANKWHFDTEYCIIFSDMLDSDDVIALAKSISEICYTVVVAKRNYKYIRDMLTFSDRIKVVTEVCFDISKCCAAFASPYSIYSTVAITNKLPLILMHNSSAYKSEELISMERLGLGIGCTGIMEAEVTLCAILNDGMALACTKLNLNKYHSTIFCTDVCKTIIDLKNKYQTI